MLKVAGDKALSYMFYKESAKDEEKTIDLIN